MSIVLAFFIRLFFNSSRLVSSIFSIIGGILVGAVILFLMGYNPLEAYWIILKGMFSRPSYMAYIIVYATPLILTGLSLIFAFRTGLFNIGAEGQFIVGALTAALAGRFLEFPGWLLIPTVLILSMMAGAIWGGFAGWCKVRFGVNEVITTIMLNWIALYLNNYIVTLPGIQQPNSESSYKIQDSARIELLPIWKTSDVGFAWRENHEFWGDFLRAPIGFGILIAVFALVVVAFILNRTTLGFRLKAVGHSIPAARYAGINVSFYSVLAMAIAGSLAALAGAVHVLGNARGVAILKMMEGTGFDGIVVSLLGSNNPWGGFFSAVFYGGIKYGGAKIQPVMGAPTEIINIIIGVAILLVSLPMILQWIQKWQEARRLSG